MSTALAPFRIPAFRLLIGGRTINALGNSFAPIALAFAVLDLTGSATDLGLVVGARTLVNVIFLLFGGVLADRLPKHLLMVGASLAAFVTQAIAGGQRFRQVAVGARVEAGFGGVGVGVRRHHEDRHGAAGGVEPGAAAQLQAVDRRHLDVSDQTGRLGDGEDAGRGVPVLGGHGTETGGLQCHGEQVADVAVVVGHENQVGGHAVSLPVGHLVHRPGRGGREEGHGCRPGAIHHPGRGGAGAAGRAGGAATARRCRLGEAAPLGR